jgi:hypothetical protein
LLNVGVASGAAVDPPSSELPLRENGTRRQPKLAVSLRAKNKEFCNTIPPRADNWTTRRLRLYNKRRSLAGGFDLDDNPSGRHLLTLCYFDGGNRA